MHGNLDGSIMNREGMGLLHGNTCNWRENPLKTVDFISYVFSNFRNLLHIDKMSPEQK